MDNKIKEKINEIKDDKTSFKEYIKCFCKAEKAEELFSNNDEFKRLKKLAEEDQEEEEDY